MPQQNCDRSRIDASRRPGTQGERPLLKHVLRNISITKLVVVQFYRNAVAVFLIAYFIIGTYMSRTFAMNAGWGDVLIGMLAVPTALAAYYRLPFWHVAVVLWCGIGVGDLILAPVTAALFGGPRTDDFPINAYPSFSARRSEPCCI